MTSKHTRRGLLVVATTLLCGCAALGGMVGPDYQPPAADLPSRWSAAPASDPAPTPADPSRNIARWWQQLDEPLLDRLIDDALAGNLDLRLAQARLRQARASRAQAASALLPSVTAAGDASRSKNAAAISAIPTRTTYDAGFDASWELDLFGGTRRGVEAASAAQAASAANVDNARVSLVAEVAQNYVDLRSYQRRLVIARDNLAAQGETLQITQWRYQAGLVTSSDVDQALANREQTRAGIPDLVIGQAAAQHRLAVLLGRHPGDLPAELAAARALPSLPATIASGIPADVLRQRPDLIAAERTLAAETARVGQTLAKRFPSLNLAGSFGWLAYGFSGLGGTDAVTHAVSGSLAATLFDGGALRSAVDVQNAVQEQALIAYQSAMLSALEEVENALTSYAAGRERVDARRAAAQAAGQAATLSLTRYQTGLADFQSVLETERTRLTSEDNLATAQASLVSSLIQLYKALGGGWERASASPLPTAGADRTT